MADEVLTILAQAALENEHVAKAMAAIGIAQNLKKEENVVVARGGGSMSVQEGLAQASRQGILAGDSIAKVRWLERLLDLECVLRHSAAWNAGHMLGRF